LGGGGGTIPGGGPETPGGGGGGRCLCADGQTNHGSPKRDKHDERAEIRAAPLVVTLESAD
jgi:hypothetical protein